MTLRGGRAASTHTRRAAIRLGVLAALGTTVSTQSPTTDGLERASRGRVVSVGKLGGGSRPTSIPLEAYVARVLAGEAEPNAPASALEAHAVAIRSYTMANLRRHQREGFDLCDTTHCQVLRNATTATREAALTTAGDVLALDGRIVEVVYSASCGGRTESASALWSGRDVPYLRSAADDVHEGDEPWTLRLTLESLRQTLARNGFAGTRLRDARIDARTESERVARVQIVGMRPDVISGAQLRTLLGPTVLRSTAFAITRDGDTVSFTGRGYGHGVGMCVIGAGRRARRGENATAILGHYFPGLVRQSLDEVTPTRSK